MPFSATQIQFLQRLVSERPRQRRAGEVSRFFCEHYSLGTVVGRSVEYRESHHQDAESLLRAHDLPVGAMSPNASRADVAMYGGLSEKSLSTPPHAKSVAVKFFGTCTVDGCPLATPAGSYMVTMPDLAQRVTCDRLLLVENLETFRRLEDYGWIDLQGLSVMAVFRGDPSLAVGDALRVIRSRAEPIWAFVDFDPAGLVIANSLPHERLERVVLPPPHWLEQATDSARGRQLFADQVDRCSPTLDQSHPHVQVWWRKMRAWKSAVTQERMPQAALPTLAQQGPYLDSGTVVTKSPDEQ
jgi:hypothetical protein